MPTLVRHVIALALWASSASAQTLTIENVTIVDVRTGRLSPPSSIVIDGQRIARVEPAGAARGRPGESLDGTGMFVIPGLWDMHVHAYFTNDTARFDTTRDLTLPLFIANGVTGVRDMGSNLDAVLAARDSIAGHQLIGPRMFVSGPMLDGPTTRYQAAIKVGTPDESRAAVRMLKERGVDFIKTQSLIPRDAYFAIADEARQLGIPFEGHVPDAIRATEAITAHQRSFEHLLGVVQASTTREASIVAGGNVDRAALLASFSAERERGIIAELARARVWQCPTIASDLNTPADLAADPALAYWMRPDVEGWRGYAQQTLASTGTTLSITERFARYELDLVRKLHAAKVPFLAGTDAPSGFDLVPGASIHRELEWFVSAGFTPLEALQTATVNPAVYLERTRDFGAVAPGKLADLVLLTRNPLVDIRNTRSVAAVVADGRFYAPAELDRLRLKLMEVAGR